MLDTESSTATEKRQALRLIEQTTDFDCGPAVLATLFGLSSPAEAERVYLGRECSADHSDRGLATVQLGLTAHEIEFILFKAGIPFLTYWCIEAYGPDGWLRRVNDRMRICTDEFVREHVAAGGAALLTVPSLSRPCGHHWILVAGRRIFDPSRGKKYESLADVTKIVCAVLIGPHGKAS